MVGQTAPNQRLLKEKGRLLPPSPLSDFPEASGSGSAVPAGPACSAAGPVGPAAGSDSGDWGSGQVAGFRYPFQFPQMTRPNG